MKIVMHQSRAQSGTGKEVSAATLQAATTKGTITLNPISGILTKSDNYQREGRGGKRLENKASKMTFLTGQQASKCKANNEAPPTESSKVTPSRDEGRLLINIVLTLTFP